MNQKRTKQQKESRAALIFMAGILCAVLLVAFLWNVFSGGASSFEGLRLSELMSVNAGYPDPKGICADWIELENSSSRDYDLSGLILSDDPDQAKYVFPSGTVIRAGEYLTVYCMKSVTASDYASFGLSSNGGERVVLMNDRGQILDEVTTFSLERDQSMALSGEAWVFSTQPSPGFPNTAEGHQKALEALKKEETGKSGLMLAVTELVSRNESGLKDEDGGFSDWFELTNLSQQTVSLKGLRISTLPGDPEAWQIGEERLLEPGQSIVIFASGKDRRTGETLHTSFRLSSEGEGLYLRDSKGLEVDSCLFPALQPDEAWQKAGDSFQKTYAATPGKPGTMPEEEKNFYQNKLVINELCASYTVGMQGLLGEGRDWIELKNLTDVPIDLTGFRLSDDDSLGEGALQGSIPAGGTVLLFSGKEEGLFFDFSLGRTGETVTLYAPWGTAVHQLSYRVLEDNFSYSRNADGSFSATAHPTPGFENTAEGLEAFSATLPLPEGLVISEVMTENFSHLPQSYGKYYDWIEVQNLSSQALSLKDYSLSDSRDKPGLFLFPDITLQPGECYTVLASGDESLSGKSFLHTVFKLSSEGEALFLFAPDNRLADALSFGTMPVGASFGRMSGQKGFFYFASPTPGKANAGGKRLVTAAPLSLTAAGAHENVSSLSVSLSGEGEIYYTLDGSAPDRGSARYESPITLTKTSVLRCFCVSEGKLDSSVSSFTYLLNEGHSLPVVSVSTAPDNLWDYNTGIYVKGPGAAATSPFRGANFYKDWEKAANVSFYDPQGEGFSVDCGLKIFGNTGRALDKKSFQLKFKSQYGTSKLQYNMFENTDVNLFDSLVLRSGSQDYLSSLLRDAVISELCYQGMPETEAQDYRYCILYLNGEYWGVYCIREKLDEDFVAAHYRVDPDRVNVLGYTGVLQHGSNRDYKAVVQYAASHDLSVQEHYDYVQERISLESYVDWFIAQMYVGNSDLDNIRYFQCSDYDGKWRWILYDFDLTFYRSANPYSYLISSSAYYSDVSALMRNLMKNGEFKDFFLKRLAMQLDSTFSEENVLSVIRGLKESIEGEMPRERERWNTGMNSWNNAVNRLESFVKGEKGTGRTQEIIDNVCETMGLSQEQRRAYFG